MQRGRDEGTAAEARRMADQLVALVQRQTGAALDFTPATLEAFAATTTTAASRQRLQDLSN